MGIDKAHLELCEVLTPSQKWAMLDEYRRLIRELHAAHVRIQNPNATDEDVLTEWFRATLDRELFEEVQAYRAQRAQASPPVAARRSG